MKSIMFFILSGQVVLNLITKGFKTFQRKCDLKIDAIIKDNIDKTRLSLTMYINKCLIKYSQDKDLLDNVLSMTDNELKKFISSNRNIVNYTLLQIKRLSFVPWAGGKLKNEDIQSKALENIDLTNKDKYIETFLGGFGSVLNSLGKLLENGIKDIFLSDINSSLINTYRQVQKNYFSVQKHLASIDLEYYKFSNFTSYYPTTKEEAEMWFKRIHNEFTQLEISKKMNSRRAALFLYLIHNSQGGMLNYCMKTNTNKFTFSYDENKVKKVALIINKVAVFNKIFNLGNIRFFVRRYEQVLKKFKNDSKAIILFDPPYIKYEEITTSKDFTNCHYNYGINDFNHRKLLEEISNGKYTFIYYNNHNPHLENFSKKEDFNYMKKNIVYTNGTIGKKCVEVIMFKDRVKKVVNSINIFNFKPLEIRKVS